MKVIKPLLLIAFLGLMIFVLNVAYQGPLVSELPSDESKETGHVFMWQVTSDQGNNMTLLGSIHIANKTIYPLDPSIEKAYDEADITVFEMDPTEVSLAEHIKQQQKGMYSKGYSIEDVLDKKQLAKLKKTLPFSLPYKKAKTYKPLTLATLLQVFELKRLQKKGYTPERGIDMHFINKAKQDKKPVLSLETYKQQVDAMSNGTDEEKLLSLLQTIEDLHLLQAQVDQTLVIWEKGDHKTLYKTMVTEVVKKYPLMKDYFKRINTDRNLKMLEKLEFYLQSQNQYFVVVGSLHLCGKEGLVELLRAKNYTVTQVKKTAKSPH